MEKLGEFILLRSKKKKENKENKVQDTKETTPYEAINFVFTTNKDILKIVQNKTEEIKGLVGKVQGADKTYKHWLKIGQVEHALLVKAQLGYDFDRAEIVSKIKKDNKVYKGEALNALGIISEEDKKQWEAEGKVLAALEIADEDDQNNYERKHISEKFFDLVKEIQAKEKEQLAKENKERKESLDKNTEVKKQEVLSNEEIIKVIDRKTVEVKGLVGKVQGADVTYKKWMEIGRVEAALMMKERMGFHFDRANVVKTIQKDNSVYYGKAMNELGIVSKEEKESWEKIEKLTTALELADEQHIAYENMADAKVIGNDLRIGGAKTRAEENELL
jgi:tetratricopeptide (TPR) repeat protein